MVVSTDKALFPDQLARPELRLDGSAGKRSIGILAFEIAAIMTGLVSLHRSLSDQEIHRLRSEAMRSQGVAYLNSTDQHLLLRLACAEVMDDLDRAAAAVVRLGRLCRGALLPRGFDRVYADLKAGSADRRISSGGVDRRVRKMERYVAATARLCAEMEVLDEMEASERKLEERLGRYSGPIPSQNPPVQEEPIRLELKSQRQKVRRLKEESLWNQSFEKAVGLMARATCSVFDRVCVVFSTFVPGLPPAVRSGLRSQGSALLRFAPAHLKLRIYPRSHGSCSSGPMERSVAKEVIIRNSCPIIGTPKVAEASASVSWRQMLEPPSSTVGGSGLALRYANVVVLAERFLLMRSGDEPMGAKELREEVSTREELYEMLPAALRASVRGKLRDGWRRDRGPLDGGLAEGWKQAVGRILGWLGPVAHDTVKWQAERNMDRRLWFDRRPRVLMLQTLHFSDQEKTEAAIAEVLVGLSCVCWYDERRRRSLRFGNPPLAPWIPRDSFVRKET